MPQPETMSGPAVGAKVGEELQHRLIDEFGTEGTSSGSVALASQSLTILVKSAVLMPAWVAAMVSMRPLSPEAASAFMSPSSTDWNGWVVFRSGVVRGLWPRARCGRGVELWTERRPASRQMCSPFRPSGL